MASDIPGDSSTTSTLTVGGSVSSSLDFVGDHDWFKINLSAGQAIDVLLHGITVTDTYLQIHDASGAVIYSNDDIVSGSNLDSEIAFSAPSGGTYYIDAGSYNDQYTGSYQVTVSPYSAPPVATNDQIANQLVNGYWGGDRHHFNVTQGGTLTVNLTQLTPSGQYLAREALKLWSDATGINFQEVTSGGQISFDDLEDGATTSANWSNGITTHADVNVAASWITTYGAQIGGYAFQAYIHEIGHALGLGHAGNYNGDATYPYDALFANDSWASSVMSYFDQTQNTYTQGQGFTRNFLATPMVADYIAIGQLYGLSTTTRTGDTTYGFNSNAGRDEYNASIYTSVAYTIFDSGGNDTLDYSGFGTNQTINLNPETFSNVGRFIGNVSIARGTVIENAIGGTGADTIIGNSVANTLTGNAGNDNINGGAGDDFLIGGAGADTLTGGAGNDTFKDTMSGHNGDTIVDFGSGDSLLFTDASLSAFTFSLTGSTLAYSGGSLTFGSSFAGSLVASAATTGGVQLRLGAATLPANYHPSNDLNGDGRSDILWHNDNGQTIDWLSAADGTFTDNSAIFSINLGTAWHVAGTGDFNGDGRSDILWRNDNGQTTDWLAQANGGFVSNSAVFNLNPGVDWHVVGTGDFNGDGRDDILWRNDVGAVVTLLGASNGSFVGNVNFSLNPGLDWHVEGTGDFNGDGRDDILWRSDNGTVVDLLGQPNGAFVGNVSFNLNPGLDWHVVGTGDFNGDGRDDILWQNNAGNVVDLLGQPNGAFVGNTSSTANPGAGWHVAATGDYNGDGIDDVLWRNDNGSTTDWYGQTDGTFSANSAFHSVLASTWHVQPVDQMF